MATRTLTKLTCNSTVYSSGDKIILRRNGTELGTFNFGSSGTQSLLSFTINDTDSLELKVITANGSKKSMGTRTAAVNPSAILYNLGSGNYALSYV